MSLEEENNSAWKAKKHIEICIITQNIINRKYPEYSVYLCSHKSKHYRKVEEENREQDFYGISLFSSPTPKNNNHIKDPDILVSDGEIAKYILEVKWGAIEGCSTSDLEDFESDTRNMKEFDPKSYWTCRIRGNDFIVNDKTRFILVSDFKKVIDIHGRKKFEEIKSIFKEFVIIFELADIHIHIDGIPSLEELI